MEIQLNDYHKKVNAQMQKSMAYWRRASAFAGGALSSIQALAEQRLARESKLQG